MVADAFCERLHGYLEQSCNSQGALVGADPGVRWNYRFLRFLKSKLRFLPWRDSLCYMQAQGYWIVANWKLSQNNGDRFSELALKCSDFVVQSQRADGAWDYPNPEWRGRVATVEGIWASLGLLESYKRTSQTSYLDSAVRWNDFLNSKIGFQKTRVGSAVNYFAAEKDSAVPNNSVLALRFLAQLDHLTGKNSHQETCQRLLDFLGSVQLANGELPYEVDNPRMLHFQCFQYHGFMLLDLAAYFELTRDARALPILHGIAQFLQTSLDGNSFIPYQCGNRHRVVYYHSMAVAAALARYQKLKLTHSGGHNSRGTSIAKLASRIKRLQRSDGSLPHSRGDYRVLSDLRPYPRYLAMILGHSLQLADSEANP